jgi:Fe-S-cluster containining protein
MKENLCHLAGCTEASCCHGAYFFNSYRQKELLRLFPDAIQVKSLSAQTEPGVYYDKFIGLCMVRIVGACPHLTPENECGIYEHRPRDCRTLPVSSRACSEFRRRQ